MHWELMGNVALLQGNPSNAKEIASESLQVFQEMGEAWGIAMTLCLLGRATGELGDLVTASSLLKESAARLRVVGDRHRLPLPLNALGLVALHQGDFASARAYLEEALTVALETQDEQYIADVLTRMGTVAFRMGDYSQSAALYEQSLALNRKQGNRAGFENLAGLAAVACQLRQPERGARLFGAVEALREVRGISLPPLRRTVEDIELNYMMQPL